MRLYFLLAISLVMTACNKSEDGPFFQTNALLEGVWELTETYSDPGDGSGDFRPALWNQTLLISGDVVNFSTGSPCQPFSQEDGESSTFSVVIDTLFQTEVLRFECTNGQERTMLFEIKPDQLTLRPICIEGCGLRYRRIN